MKYRLQLRDDTTKIHPVTVTLPGAQDDASAIRAGVAHLVDLGLPFNDFNPESDLMGIEVVSLATAPAAPVPVAKKAAKGDVAPSA